MTLNELYDIALDHNIDIDFFEMKEITSFSMPDTIIIDPKRIGTSAEEKVRLAHELGHCETGSFYNTYSSCDLMSKHEYRANKLAIKKLIPKSKLIKAIKNGITDTYELSEEFGVTQEFMQKALDFYNKND